MANVSRYDHAPPLGDLLFPFDVIISPMRYSSQELILWLRLHFSVLSMNIDHSRPLSHSDILHQTVTYIKCAINLGIRSIKNVPKHANVGFQHAARHVSVLRLFESIVRFRA
ncbi:Uncharacterised protein [Mycobacteroides abscessus subsp. abscessus]|nr:Uncharacterised protein [Mycobacteroides abscessus subsp. abscessus]